MPTLTTNALGPNEAITDAISTAYAATAVLSRMGIKVIAALLQPNRRPTLMVDALPDKTERATKGRHPNGQGGTTVTEVSQYLGCQLEWMHDVYTDEQAARIRRALNGEGPHLEVVRADH